MVNKNRAVYLPRSALNVKKDLVRYPNLNLMIDPYILIKYPSVSYFFVSKNNNELAKDIKYGLEQALQNGSFDQIFNQAFGLTIKQYDLSKRTIIDLENPFHIELPELNRSELWLEHWLKIAK